MRSDLKLNKCIGKKILMVTLLSVLLYCSPKKVETADLNAKNDTIDDIQKYDQIAEFYGGISAASLDGKWLLIDSMGNPVTSTRYDNIKQIGQSVIIAESNGKYRLLDKTGSELTDQAYDNVTYIDNSNLLVVVSNEHFGLLTAEGKEITPIKYSGSIDYLPTPALLNGKWGLLDKRGKEISQFKYDEIWDWTMDTEANVRYTEMYSYIVTAQQKSGVVDSTGKEVIALQYDQIAPYIPGDGIMSAQINNMWGFIDVIAGREIIQPQYEKTHSAFSEELVGAALNGKWGFIDKANQKIVAFEYDEAKGFSDGLASVKKNGKWGFIDKTNQEIVAFQYGEANSFSDGLASVKKNGKWGFIDKAGKIIIPFKYDETGFFSQDRKDQVIVSINGKWGSIDRTGKVVTPLEHERSEVEVVPDY